MARNCRSSFFIEIIMTASITHPKRVRHPYFSSRPGSKRMAALPTKYREILVCQPSKWQQTWVSDEASAHALWSEKIQNITDKILKNPEPCSDQALADSCEFASLSHLSSQDMGRIRRELAVLKIPVLIEHVQQLFDQGCAKLVVMAHHPELMLALKKVFPTAVFFNPGMDRSQWQVESARFQNDPQCQLFIQHIKTAGDNKFLTQATHVLFAEQEWEQQKMSYVEDCLLGGRPQERLSTQILVFANSLDEKKCQTLSSDSTCFIQLPH